MSSDPFGVRFGLLRRSVADGLRRARWRATQGGGSPPPDRPILIVACPRSGTSALFALLQRHEALRSLASEGHVIWNRYQHPRAKGWTSDRASEQDVHPGEEAFVHHAVQRVTGGRRFLDKTPKNVLRIPYLAHLFPDAFFVFLKRDGRATVSSLIEGWAARRGVSYRLPVPLRLREYGGRYWSFILPPGWRDTVGTSLSTVAATQYVASNEAALAARSLVPPDRYVEVSYEELVATPEPVVRRLLDRLDLAQSEGVLTMARELSSHHVGSISPPDPQKWRVRAEEIQAVLPMLEPTMLRLGYELEPR